MAKKNSAIKTIVILLVTVVATLLWIKMHPENRGRLKGDPELYGRPLFSKEDHEKFSEGLREVKNEEGQWGYINEAGELVIGYQFDEAYGFSEGLAVIKVNERYGYIDKTGNLVFDRWFRAAGSFSEGLAAVRVKGFRAGYINHNGEFAIEPEYLKVYDFHEGVAMVYREAGKYIYINKQGEEVPNPYKRQK